MGFAPDKRIFFIQILGEKRVRQMEEELLSLGKELEGRGIRFKHLLDDVVNFGDAEAVRLFDIFLGIAGNIVHSPELAVPEKLAKLRQAVTDLATRIAGAGGKTKTGPVSPAAKYIDDLMTQEPSESKAAKELRATGQPAAAMTADVLDGRLVRD